jgi:hypothetical protein
MSEPVVPRCSHGNIILGCPHDDCPEQLDYLAVMNGRYSAWYKTLLPSRISMDSDDDTGRKTT